MAADYGITAVDRALDVLAAFHTGCDSLGLADLARSTGVNKTTVLRICCSLERRGYLRRDPRSRYRLGPAACALGKHYEADIHLDDVVIPNLVALARTVRESASFHVRSGETRLCIYRVNAEHSVVDNIKTGDRLPLELGAAGKLLLAYEAGAASGDDIRRRGYAFSFGDRDPECAALAVPVFKFNSELCGALSVSGPRHRFTQAFGHKILPEVVAAAQRMSLGLGAQAGRTPVDARPARPRASEAAVTASGDTVDENV